MQYQNCCFSLLFFYCFFVVFSFSSLVIAPCYYTLVSITFNHSVNYNGQFSNRTKSATQPFLVSSRNAREERCVTLLKTAV